MRNLARNLILGLGLTGTNFAAGEGGGSVLQDNPSCPQIDPNHKDMDGMPLCPDEVLTSHQSAWVVYNCAIRQGKTFHAPTDVERSTMGDLLATYKKVTTEGISAPTTATLLSDASALNLQVCRVIQQKDGAQDSALLFYAKRGATNYSGPFMMLRETKHSKVIIVGPHDDSDGTFADTKIALLGSSAIATISNGHMRGNTPNAPGGKNGDFVHEPEGQNLGTFVVDRLTSLFAQSVVLHIHGMADDKKVLVRCRNTPLQNAFQKAVSAHTIITEFSPLNADFTIDPLVHTDLYLKTEMPAKIHENNMQALKNIVLDIESYAWAK